LKLPLNPGKLGFFAITLDHFRIEYFNGSKSIVSGGAKDHCGFPLVYALFNPPITDFVANKFGLYSLRDDGVHLSPVPLIYCPRFDCRKELVQFIIDRVATRPLTELPMSGFR
jgi:hypothetical protein